MLTLQEVAEQLDVDQKFLRAVKIAMGKTKLARYLDPAEVRAWLLAHPYFRSAQVKGDRWCPPPDVNPQPVDAGKSGEPERLRGLSGAWPQTPAPRNGPLLKRKKP